MAEVLVSLVLPAIAIILSLIAIRRQRLPSKYELERRIREKLKETNPELVFQIGQIEYRITSITVKRKRGWGYRIPEYLYGEIPVETSIEIVTNGILPRPIDNIDNTSIIITEGGPVGLTLNVETADPLTIYNHLMVAIHRKLPEYIERNQRER